MATRDRRTETDALRAGRPETLMRAGRYVVAFDRWNRAVEGLAESIAAELRRR